MGGVVRNIGEQGLINVENPGVPPIAGDHRCLGVNGGIVGDGLQIGLVELADDVILHETQALLRNPAPGTGIVGLDREPPAIAIQVIVVPAGGVGGQNCLLLRRDLDGRWGRPSGSGAEEEDDDPLDYRHAGKIRKALFLLLQEKRFFGFPVCQMIGDFVLLGFNNLYANLLCYL